jgi:predicted outer membrane repeat protein
MLCFNLGSVWRLRTCKYYHVIIVIGFFVIAFGSSTTFAQPTLSLSSVSALEGDSGYTNFVFKATLSEPTNLTVTGGYSTVDRTATSPDDFIATSGTLTFSPGTTTQTFTVQVKGDTEVEGDETFGIDLTDFYKSGYLNILGYLNALNAGTILNDDYGSALSIDDVSAREGNAGTTYLNFTVTLSEPSGKTVTVNYYTIDDMATSPEDYIATSGTLTFNPGTTTQTITVQVKGDTDIENTERFIVALSDASNATIIDDTAYGWIDNDDQAFFTVSDVAAMEGDSGYTDFDFTVTLSEPCPFSVSVDYVTSDDGTATAGEDFVATSGTLFFGPGETTKTITVQVKGDTKIESDEHFIVWLQNTYRAGVGGHGQGTILNDDNPPVPTISLSLVSAPEGDSGYTNFVFKATLSEPTSLTVTVDYSTVDRTATSPDDFIATSGTLTFSPGTTTQTFTVQVKGDTELEEDETFGIALGNFNNTTYSNILDYLRWLDEAGTIQNDDNPSPPVVPTISLSSVSALEGDSGYTDFVFKATLSEPTSLTVTVDYSTVDRTATSPDDFIATSGTLTFSPGTTTQTFTVQVKGDTELEEDETFGIVLANITNATWETLDLLRWLNEAGTIRDDDTPEPPDLYDDGESYRSFSPHEIKSGQTMEIHCRIRNGGEQESGPFKVRFYASIDTEINTRGDLADYFIGEVEISNIPFGETANCDWSGVFPTGIETGEYYVGWVIDSDDIVSELNEDNNVASIWSYTLKVQPSAHERRVIYVDADAPGLNDGSSWRDAYHHLQNALREAQHGNEIYVAQGTYRPDRDTNHSSGTHDREVAFELKNGIVVRGGYAGFGKQDPNERNIEMYRTILSGDLNADDSEFIDTGGLANEPTRVDNSYHVITGNGTDPTAVLEGFIIMGGNAYGHAQRTDGGGILIENGSPTLIRCTFCNCSANRGGAVFCQSGSPKFTQCTLESNWAIQGGGLYHTAGSPDFTDCTFIKNLADKLGGAIYTGNRSHPALSDCDILENAAGNNGGGIYFDGSDSYLKRCKFVENVASKRGGGIEHYYRSSSIIIESTFDKNSAQLGGAISNYGGSPTIANCIFSQNRASKGGAIFSMQLSYPSLLNCVLRQNWASENGGAMYNESSEAHLASCTLTGNIAGQQGGAAYSARGFLTLVNCILWGDTAKTDPELGFYEMTVDLIASHCNVQGSIPVSSFGLPSSANILDNIIDVVPNLNPNGHIQAGSVCIDNGDCEAVAADETDIDEDGDVNELTPVDIDKDPRFVDDPNAEDRGNGIPPIIDIGADEFLDSDGDGLPDWWELKYFGNAGIAEPDADPDDDSLTNLEEYELYSSNPSAAPIYVGMSSGHYRTIQEGIDAAHDGDTVLVAAGIYSGQGNTDIDFSGKSVVLKAINGPDATVIDCGGTSRGFDFHSGEGPGAAVVGFTISNGKADLGGAVRCERSQPQFQNCIVVANGDPNDRAGGIYCYLSYPTFTDCVIRDNSGAGIYMEYGGAWVVGKLALITDEWAGKGFVVCGNGVVQMEHDSSLALDDCHIRCNVSGPGTIRVGLDATLVIEANAQIDMESDQENGTIICDGLLRVKDNAQIRAATINITRASFEGNVNISDSVIDANSVIAAEAGAPYGQFFVEDSVTIVGNEIHADGDRYMDMDPSAFEGLVENNWIYVEITEGVGQTRGGLLELRGQDGLVTSHKCSPDDFLCHVGPRTIPICDPVSWTLEELRLKPGTKLNLTNRFDFQEPYGSGGDQEVLYVRNLILDDGAVLNTAFNRIYYENLYKADTAVIKNVPLLGFSLNMIAFDDPIEFSTRVVNNNFEHPENPDYKRIHVECVEGFEPDPNGMMRMRNWKEKDPNSSRYGEVIHARAKGLFAKSNEDQILVMFQYLFDTDEPGTELVVYLSDVPELQAPRDPSHHIEVGRIHPPQLGRPGSMNSGRFGTFHTYTNRRQLDFIRGTRVELELVGPEGASVLINNWDPQIQCKAECMDLDEEIGVTVDDLKPLLAAFGGSARLENDGTGNECVDGILSGDGNVDSYDVISGEWVIQNQNLKNLCPKTTDRSIPLCPGLMAYQSYSSFESKAVNNTGRRYSSFSGISGQGLVILGKMQYEEANVSKLINEGLYFLGNGSYVTDYQNIGEWPYSSFNIKLVKGLDGELYHINIEKGICRLGSNGLRECILAPGQSYRVASLGRYYNQGGTVYVGLQYQDTEVYGRPVWDVVVTSDYIYAVPVVVVPDGNEPYLAAAKFNRLGGSTLELATLYDNPLFFDEKVQDNPDLSSLREIEVDSQGNVYVLNTQSLNSSEVLWKYGPNGDILLEPLELTNPKVATDPHIPAPVGLCISDNALYLAAGRNEDDMTESKVYALDTADLSIKGSFTIKDMEHVTAMTMDSMGNLWIVGLNVDNEMLDHIDSWSSVTSSFYEPRIASISANQLVLPEATVSSDLITGNTGLGLPLSIVWLE